MAAVNGARELLNCFARRGDEPLLADADRTWTARDLAPLPPRKELEPGSLVGLAEPGGPGFFRRLLGIWQAGHGALLLDPEMPVAEQRRVCAALKVSALGDELLDGGARIENVAVVKLSSGTCGRPRGIAVSARALLADTYALHEAMQISDGDRIFAGISWSHSYGFSLLPMSLLVRPTTLVLPGGRDPQIYPTAPAFLQGALQRPESWPEGVRRVVTAGAPLPIATARAFRARFGLSVHVFYGASECGGICFDRSGTAAERGAVGTPIPGVDLRLGENRTVEVRSDAVANGYWPEPDPRLRDGCYVTDDVASWSAGELVLEGRRGDWINVDGRKVNPREVEEIIAAMQGVQDVVVTGREETGSGKRVVRAVIASDGTGLDYHGVRDWCRARLAPYKVPRSVIFVDEIPYTARGKPDKDALDLLA